ncbi:hypothetical protein [Sessilibacter corallicola]|uniref:Uncharacterized protein n=1 Tax=Sessilibacter corallicola TaxID=2904075 RepID=A0ABQ0A9X4_9GAMM
MDNIRDQKNQEANNLLVQSIAANKCSSLTKDDLQDLRNLIKD